MQRIKIGKILAPHGVKGEVKVETLTDFPERFCPGEKVWLDALGKYLVIEQVREIRGILLIKFQDIDQRLQCTALTNSFLTIDRQEVKDLPADHFYHFQLIGLQVYDLEGIYLGDLAEILPTGAHDVYLIKRKAKTDLLIPALKSIVQEINLRQNKMMVLLPVGLDE